MLFCTFWKCYSTSMKSHQCERLNKTVRIVKTMSPRGSVIKTCLTRNEATCCGCPFNSNMKLLKTKRERY